MKPMLAKEFSGLKDGHEYVVEPKIDGYRVIATSKGDGSWSYSSRGGGAQPWTKNLSFMDKQLGTRPKGFVYDGEIVNEVSADPKKNFEATGAARRKTMTDSDRASFERTLRFYVFDAIAPGKKLPLWQRLKDLWKLKGGKNVKLLRPLATADDDAQVMKAYRKALQAKYEGVVIKDLDGLYHSGKRTRDFEKLKAVKTYEGKILEVIEGDKQFKGAMGALLVQQIGGPKRKVKVGTGFTTAERKSYWSKRKSVVGKVIEFTVQKGTIRHPVYVRARPDRD